MNLNRPPIFLGDLACALERLRPAGEEAETVRLAIARLLGLEERSGPGVARTKESSTIQTPQPPISTPDGPTPSPGSDPGETRRRVEPAWLPSKLQTSPGGSATPNFSLGEFLAAVQPLQDSNPDWPIPAVPPLIEPNWARAIITALLATCREGEVDFEKLIEWLADARPLERIPRLPWPTLRRGAMVLLDAGPSLAPYAEDQRWLLTQLRRLLGPEKTQIFKFSGCPSRGVQQGLKRAVAWQPPVAGTPVLVVSDLGLGHDTFPFESGCEGEWLEFAESARAAGCPLIALVPASAAQFSPLLRRSFIIVEWDRSLTATRLRSLVGRAHRIH